MAIGIQNIPVSFTGSAAHGPAYVSITRDRGLLDLENAELIRRNSELRAHMALMQENIALAQAKALIECQVQMAKMLLEVQSGGHAPVERLSRKERRRQFMISNGCGEPKTVPSQCKPSSRGDKKVDVAGAPELPILFGARSRFTSVAGNSTSDESNLGDAEIEKESRVSVGQSLRTAVMMRNIPFEYTREDVLELIDEHGFQGSYAFFYLPIVFHSKENHGYAFIHFTSEEGYESFRKHFSGFSEWKVPSDRICEISSSDKFSSLEDRIESYRNSPIMHDSVTDAFKPVLFENGQRVPFAEPNKTIKAPRCKKSSTHVD